MHRAMLPLVVLTVLGLVAGDPAVAQTDEFELPPVKLKPDRPSQAKPIPPTPDERETPPPAEEKPGPAEKELPKPEKAPPVKKTEPAGPKPPAPAPTEPKKAEPSKKVPLAPEKPGPGQPPTLADLPMPKPEKEPPVIPPPTVAVPVREPGEKPPAEAAPKPSAEPTPKPSAPAPPAAKPVRPTDVQAEAIEAQVAPTVQADLSGLGEVGLVEAVARARKQYEWALQALRSHYEKRGNAIKLEWAESELQGLAKVPKPRYLLAAEVAPPTLRPMRRIEAADQLYEEGLHYKNYPAFPPGKKDYLKIALEKFQTIIEKYPESDKIDDAAFRMGEIYGGWYFQDWARAIMCYQRCWEWNPDTEYPARFNAAKIYEEKLKNRAKAVELYNAVIAHTKNEDLARQAQERLRALTGK